MIRAILVAAAACFALSACEESKSPAMAEILKAEKDISKTRTDAMKASTDYMATKEAEGGWTKTPSGILYKFVRRNPADGPKPSVDGAVLAYYHGTLPDGTVFDSAYRRGQPQGFPLSSVVKGWQQIIPTMKIDETVDVIIPPTLGYGEAGRPPSIGSNQVLQFRIELVAFQNADGGIVGPANGRPPLDTPAGVTPEAPQPQPAPKGPPKARQ